MYNRLYMHPSLLSHRHNCSVEKKATCCVYIYIYISKIICILKHLLSIYLCIHIQASGVLNGGIKAWNNKLSSYKRIKLVGIYICVCSI